LPTTRLFESRAPATLEKTGQISTALVCGGNVEVGLQCSVGGRSANFHVGRRHGCSEAPDGPVDGKVAERLGLAITYVERLAIHVDFGDNLLALCRARACPAFTRALLEWSALPIQVA
jgi:hypothetical protein